MLSDEYADEPDLHPEAPDPFALRRRVLLTAIVALVLYVAALVLLDALRAPSLAALAVAVLLYLFVVRPMMRPVREAVALRRALAFQAWSETRDTGALDDEPPPRG